MGGMAAMKLGSSVNWATIPPSSRHDTVVPLLGFKSYQLAFEFRIEEIGAPVP